MRPDKWARIKARQRMEKHGEPYDMALKKARRLIDRKNHGAVVLYISGLTTMVSAMSAWVVV